MGPKKGSGEGGKKKGKKGTPPSPVKSVTEEIVTEDIRKFYQIQIQDLEKRIVQYQKKWDEMVVKDKLFRDEFEQLAQNKKEIVSFLKRSLNQRVFEITDLSEQLQGLQLSKEMEKDAFESQLAQVRHEFQESKNQLISENVLLGGKLAALDEYRIQKEELMAKFALLEEELKKEQDQYKNWIYSLEKNSVLERDRMKKEIVQRVNKVAIEFRKVSALQMAETTRKVIKENMAVTTELAEVSNQNLQLYNENEELRGDNQEMSKQLAVLEGNKKIMSTDKMSRLKCEEQQQKMAESEKIRAVLEQLDLAFQQLQQDNNNLRNDVEELTMQLRYDQLEGKKLAEELEAEQKRRQNIERVLTEATFLLRDFLLVQAEHTEESQFNMIFQLEQKEILQQLMSMLSQAVVLGPHVAQFLGVRQKAPQSRPSIKPLKERCKELKPVQLTNTIPYRLSGAMFGPSHIPFNPKDIQLLSQTTRLQNVKVSIPHKQIRLPAISLSAKKNRETKRSFLYTATMSPDITDKEAEEEEEEEEASSLVEKHLFPGQGQKRN